MVFSAVVEWMPTRGRTVAGILLGYSFTSGQLILAGVAYLIRPWRWLQFAVSVPFLIFFLYSWYVLSREGWGRVHLYSQALTCPWGSLGVGSDWSLGDVVGTCRSEDMGSQGPCMAVGRFRIEPLTLLRGSRTHRELCLHQLLCASQQPQGIL